MKKVVIITLLGLMFVRVAFAVDISAPNFAKANAAYRDGKYDEAIADYEAILTSGFESGAIYYNLGNSYFKKQELGKAVLNYERAKRLLPRDPDVAANTQFALSEVQNDVQRPLNAWERLWEGHIKFYSVNEMALMLIILLVLFGAAHLATLYLHWKAGRLAMCAAAVLFFIFGYGLQAKLADEHNAAVAVRSSAARFEPNEKATVYFELSEGQRCQVHEREGGWAKIVRPDGKTGWVDAGSVEGI